jgi:hypothetical protein
MLLGDGSEGPPAAEDLEMERHVLLAALLGAIWGEVEYRFNC